MSMKKVLIVDDEEDMLWMLQRNLDSGIPNIETFTAQSGEDALGVLNENEIDLVISDINMPGMSGLELLTEISSKWKDTRVIIMTAYPSNAFENTARKEGALQFVEKPFDINDMRKLVEETLESEQKPSSSGGIALIDIIQFNGLAKSTSALKITRDDDNGMIYFQEGKVVHVQLGDETGEAAFFKIIEIEGAEIQNIDGMKPSSNTMSRTVESLMLEAAVMEDEQQYEQSESGFESGDKEEMDELTDELPAEPVAENSDDILTSTTEQSQNTEDENMTEIQKILAEFTNIDGVHTACLVGRDGFLLDSIARTGIDAEMIGAIAPSGFGSAETMGNQLGQGDLNMTMLEYGEGPVMFAPVGDEAFLVIVADKDTNLGWIRIAIKKNSTKIASAASI